MQMIHDAISPEDEFGAGWTRRLLAAYAAAVGAVQGA